MATIKSNGQTYLESQAIDARNEQIAKSDYNNAEEYNEKHKDAISDGDNMGKGTGDFGGHSYSVPDFTKPKEQIAYSNFNTSAGGSACDINARNTMAARSVYGPNRQYGTDVIVDTTVNKNDGQYADGGRAKLPFSCPVV